MRAWRCATLICGLLLVFSGASVSRAQTSDIVIATGNIVPVPLSISIEQPVIPFGDVNAVGSPQPAGARFAAGFPTLNGEGSYWSAATPLHIVVTSPVAWIGTVCQLTAGNAPVNGFAIAPTRPMTLEQAHDVMGRSPIPGDCAAPRVWGSSTFIGMTETWRYLQTQIGPDDLTGPFSAAFALSVSTAQ